VYEIDGSLATMISEVVRRISIDKASGRFATVGRKEAKGLRANAIIDRVRGILLVWRLEAIESGLGGTKPFMSLSL
jgi:hypothetical protein